MDARGVDVIEFDGICFRIGQMSNVFWGMKEWMSTEMKPPKERRSP